MELPVSLRIVRIHPSLIFRFHATSLEPPVIQVTPNPLVLDLQGADTLDTSIVVENLGLSPLFWSADAGLSAIDVTLEEALVSMDENSSAVTDLVPSIFLFSNGVTGTNISDGGSDMYDNGNFLNTNLGTNIPYSDGVIASNPALGEAGSYLTRKYDGLFVFAADLDEVSTFQITGNLGADGGGSVDSAEIASNIDGVNYRGFVKRVFGTGDPSVNHLIIVEDGPNLSQTFSASTDSDQHDVLGLTGQTRLYYLLFASTSGGFIDDATMSSIMETFIRGTGTGVSYLDASGSGTTAAESSSNLDLSIDLSGLSEDLFETVIRFISNDPLVPLLEVPVVVSRGNAVATTNRQALMSEAYFDWLGSASPLLEQSNPAGDLDGDGLSNLQEFVFALEPTVVGNQQILSIETQDDQEMALTYTRRSDLSDEWILLEWSTDLQSWQTLPEEMSAECSKQADHADGTTTVSYPDCACRATSLLP